MGRDGQYINDSMLLYAYCDRTHIVILGIHDNCIVVVLALSSFLHYLWCFFLLSYEYTVAKLVYEHNFCTNT